MGDTCQAGWYFFLPEYRIAFKLRDATFICWDSANVIHGTSIDQTIEGGCSSTLFYVGVSQVKTLLIQRVLSARRKEKQTQK